MTRRARDYDTHMYMYMNMTQINAGTIVDTLEIIANADECDNAPSINTA